MERFKNYIKSEDGMKWINIILGLLAFSTSVFYAVIVFSVWILFLNFCIKHTQSEKAKKAYKIIRIFAFIGFAFMIFLLYMVNG